MTRETPRQRVIAMIAAATSRPAQKRLGAILDEDRGLVEELISEAARRGVELPDEARRWPGKKLLRLSLGREPEARKRRNPIHRDDPFLCICCGAEVPPGGRIPRNHCPFCLRSLHVDEVPGARDSRCGGVMEPVGLELLGRVGMIIRYRCSRCGHERPNRAMLEGALPDDAELLRKLSTGSGIQSDPAGEE